MACTWRIRHKLILGMVLVVMTMGLLLAGTLKGLSSYKATMRTFESKLEELDEAQKLRAAIKLLASNRNVSREQLTNLQLAREALAKYRAKLDPEGAKAPEFDQLKALDEHFDKLSAALSETWQNVFVTRPGGHSGDEPGTPSTLVREQIEILVSAADDLVNNLNDELSVRIKASRGEYRFSVALLVSTSVFALLLMAGILRFFYKGVVRPMRDLERGVSRVARGDFEHRIVIRTGDEIQDLATAFNDMTDRLREMYGNLALQVNERSRQLVRSERLAGVGFLAAGVAHEINNPLASIAFCSEALESRLAELIQAKGLNAADREVITKYLKMIQEEAFRCKEITQKLLAFSRGGERKREPTNVAEIVQGVLDVVQHLQSSKGKRLVFEPSENLEAWTNAQEIKQVFLNLVVNALDSMDEGGQLTITQSRKGGMVELVFKDTGCGMLPDVLENIFEPFFTRSRTGKGTGLGLSISHRIITQHGGEIEATSVGPSQGSTFTIRLPIDPPADAETSTEEVRDPEEEFLKLSLARRDKKVA